MTHRAYVTCYVTDRDGVFEGLCVDFDIAVQGSSVADTRYKLERAVDSYMADVVQEAPEDRAHLLNRRTPWILRASLAARYALVGLVHRGRDARFRVPCPV